MAEVDFVPWTNETDFIFINDTTGGTQSNSSAVGRMGGMQVVNIFNWNNQWIMCHELAHALGFWHEQSRWDRDLYVTINYDNVSQTACSGPMRPQLRRPSGIRPQRIAGMGPYDFDSVMHYDACAFTTCTGAAAPTCPPTLRCVAACQTITVNAPWAAQWQGAIGQRCWLSRLDQSR